MKAGFWKKDWFLGLLVSLVMLLLGGSSVMHSLERSAYDWGVLASSHNASDKVAIIAIDKQSIDNIGRWPWSRDVHAKMINALAKAKAKVIGYTVFFSEPQRDPGLDFIEKMLELFPKAAVEGEMPALREDQRPVYQLLREAADTLNTDGKLARSFSEAGNVVLPVQFILGEPRGKPDRPLPDFIRKNSLMMQGAQEDVPMLTSGIDVPIVAQLGEVAAGVGHLNAVSDVDGGIRQEALALTYFDEFYPSLAVSIVAKSLNLTPKDIRIQPGEAVQIGNLKARTDAQARMYTYFYKQRDGKPPFQEDSFFDVASGKIPVEKYRDKIVLVGPTAAGLGNAFVTPVSPSMPAVELEAHTLSSLLQEHFFVVPTWAVWAELGVFALVAAYLIVLLPRLNATMGASVSASLAVVLLLLHFGLMSGKGMWLQLMQPLALLVVGHVLLVTKRFVITEAGKARSDQDSAASNRMLGLAFQGQGQLDMAFDYFRKCPLEDTVLDNLYNLALDFERKRQFNKAESVFRYIHDFNPKFRDVQEKLSRARQLSETIVLGGASGGRTNASILDGRSGAEKPMLGRYQVEKELGKGAMGVVYLGRDPKIGRVVAIKTLALAQEFEPDELVEVKERFFREAETAGRLSHPNIVTIYDAGEEHDLCYIAMELLKGKDLTPFTKPDHLLPIDKTVSIIARVADALGYAHKQNIVHRDIKPANIMYEAEADQVKVADFGIARITDSSKTKTGMVLGTPSYMSPEQLSGKKVDGKSDLFSLAVTLYQMACGKLPFEGDSMAQLMFRIANEPPPAILGINASLPAALAAFLDKAMAKEAGERYQTGEEFAAALRATLSRATSAAGGTGAASSGLDITL